MVKASFSKVSKYSKRGGKKTTQIMTPRTAVATIKKYVKAEIAKNVENKKSVSFNQNTSIMKWPTGQNAPEWCLVRFSSIFDISQNAGPQNQRAGNEIKIKKWILRGTLHPNQDVNPTDSTAQYLRYSFQGYATVYLLRLTDYATVQTTLQKLYQDGNGYNDPVGSYVDHMLPTNEDSYKIYWKRRFKLGPSASYEGTGGTNRMLNNNEFKLTADFTIDLCKYLGRDKIIKFEDGALDGKEKTPSYKSTVFAVVWSPPFGNMAAAGTVGNTNSTSFYNCTTSMCYEFEDA